MKKISSNNTFFYQYVFPLVGSLVIGLAFFLIYSHVILFIAGFLLGLARVYTFFYRMSEVYIDDKKKEFRIVNSGKQHNYFFSELVAVEGLFGVNIIKLRFAEKVYLFTPIGIEFPSTRNFTMISDLKDIASGKLK